MKPPSRLYFAGLCVLLTGLQPSPAPSLQPRIAFSSKHDGNWDIYLMNAGGGEPTRLTTRRASDRFPVWSPNSGSSG